MNRIFFANGRKGNPLNTDNSYRCFRFVQADDSADFDKVVEGWLELAEVQVPSEPKALVEGDFLAYLPNGIRLKEVSFKKEHHSVDQVLPEWSRGTGRLIGRIVDDEFQLNDGRSFPLVKVVFSTLK